ncbi:MAG: hypothetical protein AAF936_11610 [Pseudomonadota bacterium]
MFQRLIAGAVGALIIITGALAGEDKPLTEDQAKRFVATLAAVEALGDQLRDDGKIENLQIAQQPIAGEPFKPYSTAVTILKEKHPGDHAKLANTVEEHGFSTTEWGSVGDRVMVAYLAVKMQEEDPRSLEMMEGMDKSMMDMVPPEMRAQLESTFAMMETVKNAPEADKMAVMAVKDDLDNYMEKDAAS